MPKAPAFSEDDDEKTTIESGWEEEASTTVEQGDVAEKIRALSSEAPRHRNNITNVTSTNGSSVVDEPTVDDQRANALISMMTPASVNARLLITQGNDTGQQIEVLPGKSYTIGRGIDNDFVLTDIAVSRKHFDLRHEGGAWLLADRGSGNGTLINGNIEDQPFLLANGDQIEIGNTTFRFEQANGAARPAAGAYDVDLDEEEPSTVAGKPIRSGHEEIPTPSVRPGMRAKTIPPPAPLPRPRNGSGAPPSSYPNGSQNLGPQLPGMSPFPKPLTAPPQMQAPQMMPQMPRPLPQMQPVMPPQMMPQMPQALPATTLPMPQMANRPPVLGAHAPTMLGEPKMPPLANGLPTTIPGQGLPMPYSYPNVGDISKNGHVLVVGNTPGRDATSTALVQPTPYGMMPVAQPVTFAPPQLSRRTKLLLAGAGLALLAAIATIAIIKGSSSDKTDTNTAVDPPKADPPKVDPPKTAPPKVDPPKVGKGVSPKTDPPKVAKTDPPKVDPPKVDPPKVDPPKVAATDPAKTDPPKVDPPKVDPPKVAVVDPPKVDPPKTTPPKTTPPKTTPPKTTPPKTTNRRNQTVRPTPPKTEPPKTEPKPRTRVATADSNDAKNRANELYRSKKFSDAAAVLRAAAASSPADATDLRSIASVYDQLGRAYNRGMAPAAPATEAYGELRTALNLDGGSAGGAFTDEIKAKLGQVAGRAAISFLSKKDYERAFQAVRTAEQFGNSTSDTKIVRQNLESTASQIYSAAAAEIGSNPEAAKNKLRQIKGMVDPKSPTWVKANKLLTSN